MAKSNEIANGMRKFLNMNTWLFDAAKLLDDHGTFEDAARVAKSQCDTAKAELTALQDEMAEFKKASGSVKQAYDTALDKAAVEGVALITEAKITAKTLLDTTKDVAAKIKIDATAAAKTRLKEADKYVSSSKDQHLAGIEARSKEIADLDNQINSRTFKVATLTGDVSALENKLAGIKAQLAKMIG